MDEFEMDVINHLVRLLPERVHGWESKRREMAVALFRANVIFAATLRFDREAKPWEVAMAIYERPVSEYEHAVTCCLAI